MGVGCWSLFELRRRLCGRPQKGEALPAKQRRSELAWLLAATASVSRANVALVSMPALAENPVRAVPLPAQSPGSRHKWLFIVAGVWPTVLSGRMPMQGSEDEVVHDALRKDTQLDFACFSGSLGARARNPASTRLEITAGLLGSLPFLFPLRGGLANLPALHQRTRVNELLADHFPGAGFLRLTQSRSA